VISCIFYPVLHPSRRGKAAAPGDCRRPGAEALVRNSGADEDRLPEIDGDGERVRHDGAIGVGHPTIARSNGWLDFAPAMAMAVVLLTVLGVTLYGLVPGLERLFVVKDVRLQ
jgi:hypothetical protein